MKSTPSITPENATKFCPFFSNLQFSSKNLKKNFLQKNILTLRRLYFLEPQAPFWVDLAHHFSTANLTTKEWFYPKNDISINYTEFSSAFFKGT